MEIDPPRNTNKFRNTLVSLCTGQFGIQWALHRFTDTSHPGCERLDAPALANNHINNEVH
jgi:hypothetical protein